MPIRDTYVETASHALDLLGDPQVASKWKQPSVLPQMTVGALAGHLGRSVIQVETYVEAQPPPYSAPTLTAVEYYAGLVGVDDLGSDLNRGVRQRAGESAAAGPEALVSQVGQSLRWLRGRLPNEPSDRRVVVFKGRVLLLDQYLLTRLIELTVHLDDLTMTLGRPMPEIPEAALEAAIGVLVGIAQAKQGSVAVLRALTRRERDPSSALRVL